MTLPKHESAGEKAAKAHARKVEESMISHGHSETEARFLAEGSADGFRKGVAWAQSPREPAPADSFGYSKKAAEHAGKVYPFKKENDHYKERGIAAGSYMVGAADYAAWRDARDRETLEKVGNMIDDARIRRGDLEHVWQTCTKALALLAKLGGGK